MCPRKSRKSSECFPILRDSGLERAAVPCPLLEGKEEAWVACCSKRFFPLARRIAGEDDLAQEVLQESWAKILKAIHAYRGGSPACAWVHAIVSHSAIKAGKARSKAREREVPIAEYKVKALHPAPNLWLKKNRGSAGSAKSSSGCPRSTAKSWNCATAGTFLPTRPPNNFTSPARTSTPACTAPPPW